MHPSTRHPASSSNPHSTCSFVPAYLLRQLADAATNVRTAVALQPSHIEQTLVADERFRAGRGSARALPTPTFRATAAAALEQTRVIHTANNTEDLPGEPVRGDGDPASGDEAVDEAFDSSGQVYDLFASVFGRRSIDGQGTPISVTVHYGVDYDNAFWDGSQLVFGDGDGTVFHRFTKPFDVMAHEFTHGVTEHTAGLTYQGQSGALNESVSDVFACLTKQRVADQTSDQADWLIGQDIFLPGVNATALRSMSAPGTAYDDPRIGKDPQVGSMADYVDTTEDNGGVHINSGIPNRAFYLVATAIGGHSWETPGAVWYDALTSGEVNADADFASFAAATLSSAARLFADDTSVADKVRAAWQEVGLLIDEPVPSEPAPTDPVPTEPVPAEPLPARWVTVRRSGGVTGVVREAAIDLHDDPKGPELANLLDRVDLQQLTGSAPSAADRFTYSVQYGSSEAILGEHELGPDLRQVVRIVLDN